MGYDMIFIDLRMPLGMVPADLTPFMVSVLEVVGDSDDKEVLRYTGIGINAAPYIGAVRARYVFVEILPVWMVKEARYIIRFVFAKSAAGYKNDALSQVRRKMYINWLTFYTDRYACCKVSADETIGKQTFLRLLLDDLVQVVDDDGERLRGPMTGSEGKGYPGPLLNHEGFITSTDQGAPMFKPLSVHLPD